MAETTFVTGGSGFIGGKLVQRLVSEGRPVRALARSDAAAEKVAALGAEPAMRNAAREGFETVAVRPRFVWGKGDTSYAPVVSHEEGLAILQET